MQIRESGKSAIQTTKSMLNLGKDYTIPFGNDQETEGEETYPDPTRFMNISARRAWRRLPERKKERYLRQSMNAVKRKSRKKNTIFVEEEKDLFQIAAKTSGDQYLKELQHTEIEKNTRQNKTDSKQKIEKESVTSTETTMSYAVKSPTEMIKTMIMPSKTTVSNGMPANNGIAVSGGVQAGGVSVSLAVGKKMAEAFLKTWKEQEVQKQQWKSAISSVSEQKQGTNVFKITVAALGTVMLKMVVAFFQVVTSFLISVVAAILAVLPVTVVAVLVAVVVIIACAVSTTTESTASAGHGLPDFVTEDMMQAFFETQEESGIPVSSGIAQLIVESGFGSYGPGGENGRGLSGLAYNYHNLFGIKYFSGDQYATGSVNMQTGEETSGGDSYEIVAGFSIYPDYAACIKQRAWMLNRSPYLSHISTYKNKNDGKYTKQDADNFVQGIKNAGWATSNAYVENCKAIMQQYNLYQFDNMSWSDYQNGAGSITYDGTITPMMQKISDIARNNAGTYPCTPDMCAAWVTGVYQAAGASIVPYGNAIDMWNVFKNTGSTDMSNIPPGAIVCGSGKGYMGSLYGHVGVYIGNGMVANNIGRFSIESLQSWCAWQTATCQGHTGWIGWVYPGGVPTE